MCFYRLLNEVRFDNLSEFSNQLLNSLKRALPKSAVEPTKVWDLIIVFIITSSSYKSQSRARQKFDKWTKTVNFSYRKFEESNLKMHSIEE